MLAQKQRSRPSLRRITALLAVPALLAGCGAASASTGGSDLLQPTDAIPAAVPEGTTIAVGDPVTRVALELSGELDNFTFDLEFVNLSGGPQTAEAFRAKALDVGSVADIPPVHAAWTGLSTRIVAAKYRQDAVQHPIYELGIAPGVNVARLEDLRGKTIAYSPGQAQGALVLRVLEKAGLAQTDVKLVELPSTGDAYSTALASRQVEVAPLGNVQIKRYLANYGRDGATTLRHGLRDDPSLLYVLESSLEDPAKAAAIREYVERWGAAQAWIHNHPREWLEGYYVKDQGLSAEDGQWLIDAAGVPDIPVSWNDPIARHQETVDLLSREQEKPGLDAATLYDKRFESVGGEAFRAAGGAR